MTIPAMTVAIFCTTWAKASPTRLRTVEASVDNLAPTAPLNIAKRKQKWFINMKNLNHRFAVCLMENV